MRVVAWGCLFFWVLFSSGLEAAEYFEYGADTYWSSESLNRWTYRETGHHCKEILSTEDDVPAEAPLMAALQNAQKTFLEKVNLWLGEQGVKPHSMDASSAFETMWVRLRNFSRPLYSPTHARFGVLVVMELTATRLLIKNIEWRLAKAGISAEKIQEMPYQAIFYSNGMGATVNKNGEPAKTPSACSLKLHALSKRIHG